MNEVERRGEIFGAVERVFGLHQAIDMLNEHDAAVRADERARIEDLQARVDAIQRNVLDFWDLVAELQDAGDEAHASTLAILLSTAGLAVFHAPDEPTP